MVTVYFKPGNKKPQIAKAIKRVLNIRIIDAVDASEVGRVECDKSEREALVKAIEEAGGKLV